MEYHFQKAAAESAVRNLKGVKGISNWIAITPHVSTTDVKSRIEQALERAAQVDAKKISVETADGKVILRGNVRNWAERQEAERAAWGAPGVSNVQNEINIIAAVGA